MLSYRHGETRVNNPEVGMVHADTDPDGEKTVWAYDPHLDPVLNFDNCQWTPTSTRQPVATSGLGSPAPVRTGCAHVSRPREVL